MKKEGSSVSQRSISFDSGIMYRYMSYITIVFSVWSYVFSKCFDTNVYIKERMNCSERRLYQNVTSGESRVCLSRYSVFGQPKSLLFFKNGLKLRKEIAVEMIPKYAKNK